MNGLRTARVLVVDDDVTNDGGPRSEAFGIIQAFSSAGIGIVFCDGTAENLPAEPSLRGIRLAAVDLDLGGLYPGEESKVVAQTLQVLKALIHEANGPYLALAWTKHKELVDAFRAGAGSLPCPPIEVAFIEKATVQDAQGNFDVVAILEALSGALSEAHPLEIYNLWEQLVHDAATDTVNISGTNASWTSDAVKVTNALLSSNKAASDDSLAWISALFESLNPLHFDCLQALTATLDAEDVSLGDRLKAGYSGDVAIEQASEINRRLHLTSCIGDAGPGFTYLMAEVEKAGVVLPFTEESVWAALGQDGKKPGVPILIEMTPLCDQQQGNMTVAKLIAGLAVPVGDANEAKKAGGHIRDLGPIRFGGERGLEGNYRLLWTSRLIATTPVGDLTKCPPVGRIRQAALVDMQAWLGTQTSRPGVLLVRPTQ